MHISFVRSITMDLFKPEEVLRMEKGGNDNLKSYFEANHVDLLLPPKLKYDNYVAEDYKEKLTCLVEGRDFVAKDHGGETLPTSESAAVPASASVPARSVSPSIATNSEPIQSRRQPLKVSSDQRQKNEAYFAELGTKNNSRPDDVPPSQGGKFSGFGNTPAPAGKGSFASFSLDNLQADPLGTLTKGWGLFSSTVAKSVSEVNESVIKPGLTQIQQSDFSSETKRAMAQFGQKMQETGKYGQETFQSFTNELHSNGFNRTVDLRFGKLFDGLSLNDESAPAVEPAFGFSKPHQKTSLSSASGGKDTSGGHKEKGDDKWDDF